MNSRDISRALGAAVVLLLLGYVGYTLLSSDEDPEQVALENDELFAPSDRPELDLPEGEVTLERIEVVLEAIVPEGKLDEVAEIKWRVPETDQRGEGLTFAFVAEKDGQYLVEASLRDNRDRLVQATTTVTVEPNPDFRDADDDGLVDSGEVAAGTDLNNPDSDGDGITDGVEVSELGSDPLSADSDDDGIPDPGEIALGTDPIVADSEADLDGDGSTNIAEFEAGTNAANALFFPGGVEATRFTVESGSGISLSDDGLSATFSGGTWETAWSNSTIAAGSGWYYVEATFSDPADEVAFGVTGASTLPGGDLEDEQTVMLAADGELIVRGESGGSLPLSAGDTVGFVIDYDGIFPLIYIITDGRDGRANINGPIPVDRIDGSMRLLIAGAESNGAVGVTVNAGDAPLQRPMVHAANYWMYLAEYESAEFMAMAWGNVNDYQSRPSVPIVDRVYFDITRPGTGPGINVDETGLMTAYAIDQKMGVLANQAIIGDFWYWESERLTPDPENLGQGVMPGAAIIDPYPSEFDERAPYPDDFIQPAISLNSLQTIWQYPQGLEAFDTEATHYGFAVDYRGSRPVVYVIVNDEVALRWEMEDTFVPLHPILYGNENDGLVQQANFGTEPFAYDPRAAITEAGFDASGLELGWGPHIRDE